MTIRNCWDDDTEYDFAALVGALNQYLRLRTTPVGMKRFAQVAELDQIQRLRRFLGQRPAYRRALSFDSMLRGAQVRRCTG